jgi:hypothetical protein
MGEGMGVGAGGMVVMPGGRPVVCLVWRMAASRWRHVRA